MDRALLATLAGVLIGYLLGSVLPAWLVARARGIDIRKVGSGNPGISNLARTMGYGVAAAVAPYDVLKGPLAIVVALYLGAPTAAAYLAGAAAFVGHRAPFYLGFRGGTGIAPLVGIGLFATAAIWREDPRFGVLVAPLLALMAAVFFTRMRRRQGRLFVFVFLPALLIAAIAQAGIGVHTVVLLAVGALVVGHRILELLEPKLVDLSAQEQALLRRKWIRPAAIAFPLAALWSRTPTLVVLGAVLLTFVVVEVMRFRSEHRAFPRFYRPAERERISSVVIFLLGMLVTLTLFRPEVASLAVLFLIFGDLMAFCVGTAIGGPGFFDKTWSGTAACLVACVILVSIYASLGLVPWVAGLLGALVATAGEALPIADDNFVVPVASALAMTLF